MDGIHNNEIHCRLQLYERNGVKYIGADRGDGHIHVIGEAVLLFPQIRKRALEMASE